MNRVTIGSGRGGGVESRSSPRASTIVPTATMATDSIPSRAQMRQGRRSDSGDMIHRDEEVFDPRRTGGKHRPRDQTVRRALVSPHDERGVVSP